MKTTSNRARYKCEGEGFETKQKKAAFKGMQILVSSTLNLLMFYILKMYFISDNYFYRLFQVFIIVIIAIIVSNMTSLLIITRIYKGIDTRALLSRDNSYVKFFITNIVYSFVAAVCFSFGVFQIVYNAYGDDTIVTLLVFYLIGYLIIEFFAYGIVTWAYNLTRNVKRGK